MSRDIDKKRIERALKKGKQFAKTADKLQEETGIESGRTQEPLREIIRELIKDGLPIGSLQCGYWIIANKKELSEAIKNLKSRRKGIESRIKEIRKAFKNFYS